MVIILSGVSGAGKTTLGRLLAAELGWHFYDADDFHPQVNIDKMRRNLPLTDADRRPWLEKLASLIDGWIEKHEDAVLACSALKESYRRLLRVDNDAVKLVYLKGGYAVLRERLKRRHGHFMAAALLKSQFAALEEPQGNAIVVQVDQTPPEIIKEIRDALKL
jgi:gluconokinase